MVSCEELEKEVLQTLVGKFGMKFEDLAVAKKLLGVAQKYAIAKPHPQVVRDAKDGFLLALIEASQAKILITGDKDLLVLREYQGCYMMSPGEFLERLESWWG
jgi:putative PIN family toxin of toxin-antitoxin system